MLYLLFRSGLFYLPDVAGLKQFGKVVVLLLLADFGYLGFDGFVVGGGLDVADYSQGDGESVAVAHEGELELECVVLTMGVVDKYVVDGHPVLAYLYDLEPEALLYEAVFVVLTEDEGLPVLDVDGVFGSLFLVVDGTVATVVEDYAVLQYLAYGGSFVGIGCLEDFDCAWGIGGYGAREEVSACSEA